MQRLTFVLMLMILPLFSPAQQNYKDRIAELLETGNAAELSNLFIASIDLTLLETDDVYSRQQAKMILQKFFRDNPPSEFRYKHEGRSKLDAYYYIGDLTAGERQFRVTFFLSESDGQMQIKQLRIEEGT